jgi:hypothetical protein
MLADRIALRVPISTIISSEIDNDAAVGPAGRPKRRCRQRPFRHDRGCKACRCRASSACPCSGDGLKLPATTTKAAFIIAFLTFDAASVSLHAEELRCSVYGGPLKSAAETHSMRGRKRRPTGRHPLIDSSNPMRLRSIRYCRPGVEGQDVERRTPGTVRSSAGGQGLAWIAKAVQVAECRLAD